MDDCTRSSQRACHRRSARWSVSNICCSLAPNSSSHDFIGRAGQHPLRCHCRLLAGDIINGKPESLAVTQTLLQQGYTAIYYLDSAGHYQIAVSLLQHANGTQVADTRMPSTDWLEDLRYNSLWYQQSPVAATTRGNIGGQHLFLAAQVSLWTSHIVFCTAHRPASIS